MSFTFVKPQIDDPELLPKTPEKSAAPYKWIIITIIVVFIVGLIIVLIYTYMKSRPAAAAPKTKTIPAVTQTPAETPPVEEQQELIPDDEGEDDDIDQDEIKRLIESAQAMN